MKQVAKKIINKLGYEIKPIPKIEKPLRHWDRDISFNLIYDQIKARTSVSKQRCYILFQLAIHVASLPGDVAEIGVYKGGTAKLLSNTLADSSKSIYLFDTFSGMPKPDAQKDTISEGVFSDTSLESVSSFLNDCSNVSLYKGIFPETAGSITEKQFSLVHVDVDLYQSVLNCCEFFYPRTAPGGLIIFDDYGGYSCPGAKLAVDEFFSNKPEYPCYLPSGQCIVIRLAH